MDTLAFGRKHLRTNFPLTIRGVDSWEVIKHKKEKGENYV